MSLSRNLRFVEDQDCQRRGSQQKAQYNENLIAAERSSLPFNECIEHPWALWMQKATGKSPLNL
jgi:hypothetical protein